MAGQTTGKKTGKDATKSAPTRRRAKAPKADAASGSANASERIDQAIADLKDWRGDMLAQLRRLIHAVDPDVVEDWKWMGTPVWSHDGMYALANAHKDKVKITFHHGAHLRDPGKLFNAGLDGNKWRAIDIREGERLNASAFKALLREAIDYNLTHHVPKSKGSRLPAQGTRAPGHPARRKSPGKGR